jgi:hypothetical protein
MRLHSNVITEADIYAATRDLPGVCANVMQHGSRSRLRAFEVSLDGNGYARNTGFYGAGSSDDPTATWDEWGAFMAALFAVDPDAFWGSASYPAYVNVDDFNRKTADRFSATPGVLPADTHKRHTFRDEGRCVKCSAQRVYAA